MSWTHSVCPLSPFVFILVMMRMTRGFCSPMTRMMLL